MHANVTLPSLFLIQFFSVLLASCSKTPRLLESSSHVSVREFTQHFATHPADSTIEPLLKRLRDRFVVIQSPQEVYTIYLIGSVSASGQADERALGVGCEHCKAIGSECLPDLLAELSENNSVSTMARFVAQKIDHLSPKNLFGRLLSVLMRESRSTVEALFREVSAILKEDESRSRDYGLMLSWLPIEEQYEMVSTGQISLGMLRNVQSIETSNYSMREIFFMAKYSTNCNPSICRHVAEICPRFHSLMPDGMLPVCIPWCDPRSEILRSSRTVHGWLLRDLVDLKLKGILTVAPWKYWLQDETSILGFVGWCMVDSATGGILPEYLNTEKVKRYLEAVMDGSIPLLEMGCATPYDSFLKLVEMFCECVDLRILTFSKPEFFTDGEYQQAIGYFACEKNWDLKLPESWVADNLLEVFNSIKQDVDKMDRILSWSFKRSLDLHCMLLIRGQRGDVPDMLIKQILSVSSWFKELSESESVRACNYYDYIIESGALHEPIVRNCRSAHLLSLVLGLILHCKGDHEKMSKLVTSTLALSADDEDDPDLKKFRLKFGQRAYEALMSSGEYLPEEVELVTNILRKCALLGEHGEVV